MPQYIRQPVWNFLLFDQSCTNGIINIRIDIGNLIGKADNLALQRSRCQTGLMIQNVISFLPDEIQPHSFFFQTLHHTYTLFIMPEASQILRDPV